MNTIYCGRCNFYHGSMEVCGADYKPRLFCRSCRVPEGLIHQKSCEFYYPTIPCKKCGQETNKEGVHILSFGCERR